MKKIINPGVYGWRHKHWIKSFYPEDLPVNGAEDWRLAYYSNEFKTVMVPFDYWQARKTIDCEGWLDDVNEDFQFFVECHESMLEHLSAAELTDCLNILQPQLSGLVFLEENPTAKEKFSAVIDALAVDVFEPVSALGSAGQKKWCADKSLSSALVIIENDLSDLRAVRTLVENIAAQRPDAHNPGKHNREITVIIDHPKLTADKLIKFRSVLEIMGY